MEDSTQTASKRSIIYLYAMLAFSLFFLYSVIFGYSSYNLKLVFGAVIFLLLLILSYYNVSGVFLALIFFIPYLIGADVYQINISSFVQNFLPVKDLYINPFSLVCLMLIFLAIVEFFKKNTKIFKVPLFFILCASAILSLITLAFSQYKSDGLVFELYLISGFAAYFLGYFFLGSKTGYLKTIFVVMLSSIMPSMYAFMQLAVGDYFYEADSALGRIRATFPHSNTFGSYLFVVLTVMLIAILAIKIKSRNEKNNWTLFLPLLILSLLLVMTYSRTAWIGFALTIFAVAVMKPSFRLPFVYGGFLISAVLLVFEKTRERILGIFEHHMFDSMYGRREIWDMAIFAAKKSPIFGYGIGSFETIIRSVQGKETGNVYPHNDMVRFFLEGGVVGLAAYFLYVLGALYYALKSFLRYSLRQEETKLWGRTFLVDYKFLGLIPFLLFSIMVVISLVEAPSMDFVYQIFAWTLLGSWLGMSQEYYKITRISKE